MRRSAPLRVILISSRRSRSCPIVVPRFLAARMRPSECGRSLPAKNCAPLKARLAGPIDRIAVSSDRSHRSWPARKRDSRCGIWRPVGSFAQSAGRRARRSRFRPMADTDAGRGWRKLADGSRPAQVMGRGDGQGIAHAFTGHHGPGLCDRVPCRWSHDALSAGYNQYTKQGPDAGMGALRYWEVATGKEVRRIDTARRRSSVRSPSLASKTDIIPSGGCTDVAAQRSGKPRRAISCSRSASLWNRSLRVALSARRTHGSVRPRMDGHCLCCAALPQR